MENLEPRLIAVAADVFALKLVVAHMLRRLDVSKSDLETIAALAEDMTLPTRLPDEFRGLAAETIRSLGPPAQQPD